MEVIKNLLSRLRHTGVLFLIGLILIIYIALGFVYWQQGAQQEKFTEQIAKLNVILSKPLPSVEKLQAEYETVNLALAPMTDVAAIAMLVGIARENGIDVDEHSGKFHVPTAAVGSLDMAGGTYQVLSFTGITVQGDDDNVMAFVADLDAGKTLKTMVLNQVTTSQVEVAFAGEEGARRAEFRSVVSAVMKMIIDNGVDRVPNPMSFDGGLATNFMGDDPTTNATVEGFPDITTTAAEKGYSGNATPRGGYVLYQHDKISTTDNITSFKPVDYIATLTTKYYYTAETDSTVRQFNKANVPTATEYVTREPSKMETVVTVDVDIYFKP